MAIGVLGSYLKKLGNVTNFCPPISYPEQK